MNREKLPPRALDRKMNSPYTPTIGALIVQDRIFEKKCERLRALIEPTNVKQGYVTVWFIP